MNAPYHPNLGRLWFQRPGDEVWLFDASSNLVDMVSFEESIPAGASSMIPTPAFLALGASPARDAPSRPPSRMTTDRRDATRAPCLCTSFKQPESQEVDGCGDVTFGVLAGGLPRPRYQWQNNGDDGFTTCGCHRLGLTHLRCQPGAEGEYRVCLDNGFASLLQ